MSSLDQVRERLSKINNRKVLEHNSTVEQSENSVDLTESGLISWRERIQQSGNQPADWLKYLRFMRDNMTVKSHKSVTQLNNMYAYAFKAIPPHLVRKNRDHAQLMVDFAIFRSEHWEQEARQIFLQARSLCKHFAFVHVAAAQFELNTGNQGKARKILEKANSERAEPTELLMTAFTNLLMNKTVLLDEETAKKFENADLSSRDEESKENTPVILNPRPSAPTPLEMKYSSSQLPGMLDSKLSGSSCLSQKYSNTEPYRSYLSSKASNLCHANAGGLSHAQVSNTETATTAGSSAMMSTTLDAKPSATPSTTIDPECTPLKDVRVELPLQNVTTRKLTNPKGKSESSPSGDMGDGASSMRTSEMLAPLSSSSVFKQPTPSVASRERHTSTHSDDGDSAPVSYDVHRNVFVRSSASKLRSFNSTPDCKSFGFFSSVKKRRPPMRVPARTSLPELNEDANNNNSEEASFHLQPLPETPRPPTQQSSSSPEHVASSSGTAETDGSIQHVGCSEPQRGGDEASMGHGQHEGMSFIRRFSIMDTSDNTLEHPLPFVQDNSKPLLTHQENVQDEEQRRAMLKREESMETDQKHLRMDTSLDCDELMEPMDVDATAQHRHHDRSSVNQSSSSGTLRNVASPPVVNEPPLPTNPDISVSSAEPAPSEPADPVMQPALNMQPSPLMPRAQPNQAVPVKSGVTSLPGSQQASQVVSQVVQPDPVMTQVTPAGQSMVPVMQTTPVMMQLPAPGLVPQSVPCMTPQSGATQQAVSGMQPSNSWLQLPGMPQNQRKILTVNGEEYMVMKTLGKGGSSTVYQVLTKSSQTRAVKVVDMSEADEAVLRSFLNEIALLQRLQNSQRIIHMYDHHFCRETSTLYVVMEEGQGDLFQHFRAAKQGIGPVEQKYFWKQMLEAVAVLHNEGIVHCDLKPANFILVHGQVKLIDFGIANAIQQDKTSVTCYQILGTLNFMSPEAIMDTQGSPDMEDGKTIPKFKISVKSDVWSLGCILYSLVYGYTPFNRVKHQIAKMQAIINPNYEIEFRPHPDKYLVNVLQSCLKRDPHQRPSIKELLNHPYLTGEAVIPSTLPTDRSPTSSSSSAPDLVSQKELLKRQLDSANLNSPGSISKLLSAMQGLLDQKMSGK